MMKRRSDNIKDYEGNEIKRMEVYVSVMVDVTGKTEHEAYDASSELANRISGILSEHGIEVYDTYEVFRNENDECVDAVPEE